MAVPEAPPQPDAGATPAPAVVEAAPASGREATPPTPPVDAGAEDGAEVRVQQHSTLSRRDRERLARAQSAPAPVAEPPAEPAPSEAPAPAEPAEPAKPSPSPEDIIAAYRKSEEERAAKEKADREKAERTARFVGNVPHDPKNPNGPTEYDYYSEIANQVIPPLPYEATQEQHNEREAAIAAKNAAAARVRELNDRRGMLDAEYTPMQQTARSQALHWAGGEIEAGVADLGIDLQKIVAVAQANPGQLKPMVVAIGREMAEQIRRDEVAPLKARVAELEEDNTTLENEVAEFQRQAGGQGPNPARGGVTVSAGSMTRSEFMALPKDQKDKMRRDSPDLVAEIYSRSA